MTGPGCFMARVSTKPVPPALSIVEGPAPVYDIQGQAGRADLKDFFSAELQK